jgi:quinol monooxygenase YgiN
MKTKPLSFFILALFVSFIVACGSPGGEQGGEATAETTEENAAEQEEDDIATSQRIALIIVHEVEDYEMWKAKFDEHSSARQDAGMSDWALLTDRDNPNLVTVIESVGDMDAAEEFIVSEDLKSAMEGAGVVGEPDVWFSTVEVLDSEAAKSSNVRLYVQHEVEDYDKWRTVFDSKSDLHAEAGVSPVAIARNLGNTNALTVVLTAADFETLENFANNPDLKEAMMNAGVVVEPEFKFMNLQSLDM